MSRDFETNKPFGFVPDEETEKLRRAVHRFHLKIQPFPKEPDVTTRDVAKDLISNVRRHREVKRSYLNF